MEEYRVDDQVDGQMEEVLDKQLEALIESMPEYDRLEKAIESSIKRKIKRVVYRTIGTMMAVLFIVFLGISPVMNAIYTNPAKLNEEPDITLQKVMRTYWETVEPYMEVIGTDVEEKGFARYEISMEIANHREALYVGVPNAKVEMVCGKYKDSETNQLLYHTLGRFSMEESVEEVIEDFKELPKSAKIYLSVSEKAPRPIEELKKEAIDLEWIQVYQPNVEFQGGMNMYLQAAFDDKDRGRRDMNAEELKEVYISNLEQLQAYPQLWTEWKLKNDNTVFVHDIEGILEKCLEDAKQIDVLQSQNYCISGQRDEIVEYLEKVELVSVKIDDIRLIG